MDKVKKKKQLQTMTSCRKVSRKLITRSREIAVSCLYSTMAPRGLQFQLLGVGWKTWNVLTSLSKTQLHKFVDWTPFLTLIFLLFWGLSARSWDQAPRSLTRCGGKTLTGAASFRLKLSSWIKLLDSYSVSFTQIPKQMILQDLLIQATFRTTTVKGRCVRYIIVD